MALQEKFPAPQEIVDNLLRHREDLPGTHVPDIQNLKKAINRARAKARPAPPPFDDPLFPVAEDFFAPGFYRGAIFAGRRHPAQHLSFCTDIQLRELNKCKWYVDGTFKIIAPPFTQPWTISAFIKNDKGKR